MQFSSLNLKEYTLEVIPYFGKNLILKMHTLINVCEVGDAKGLDGNEFCKTYFSHKMIRTLDDLDFSEDIRILQLG